MYINIPELKRCCCCIPLRPGLIFWGYLKLILTIGYLIYEIKCVVTPFKLVLPVFATEIDFEVAYIISAVIYVLDILFTIIFVIAIHMRNQLFLKVYNYYNIIQTLLFVVWGLLHIGFLVYLFSGADLSLNYLDDIEKAGIWMLIVYYLLPQIFAIITITVIQVYIILVVRSVIIEMADADGTRTRLLSGNPASQIY